MLRFSIAVPIGRWHPLLPTALRSLAVQDRAVEVAVLDASGDPRVAAALDAAPLEYAYRRAGPDDGQAAAIAEGWAHTTGEIVGWLNADDYLIPGALDAAAAAFEGSDRPDVVYGDSTIVDIDGAVVGFHGQVGAVGSSIAWRNPVSQPSCFCRRSVAEAVGGINPNLRYAMDWELWIRLHRRGVRFLRLKEVLSSVYWGAGSKTSEMTRARLTELFHITRRYAGVPKALRLLLGVTTAASADRSLLRRWAGRRTVQPPPGFSGLYLAADHNPLETPVASVRLPVVNPHAEPMTALEVRFRGPAGRVSAPPGSTVSQAGPESWLVTADTLAPPGQAIELELSAAGGIARLAAIVWRPTPELGASGVESKETAKHDRT